MKAIVGGDLDSDRYDRLAARVASHDELDSAITAWTEQRIRWDIAKQLQAAGIPAAAVTRPAERIDGDINTADWGLWPMVEHPQMGGVRVDGEPVHFSKTDWSIESSAPTLGQHNRLVFGKLLGLTDADIDDLVDQEVI